MIRAGLLGLSLACLAAPVRAQDTGDVVACDSLVALRVAMAHGDRAAVMAALPNHPACRRVARTRVGTAEHRAMVGGAPFECLALAGEARCVWIMP